MFGVLLLVLIAWGAPAQAQDPALNVRLSDGRSVSCPIQSLGAERYVGLSSVNDLMRAIDPRAATQWNASTGVYRAQAAGCDFSLYQRQAMLLCNNAMIETRLPLLAARGTVFIPLDSLVRVLKYFEGVETDASTVETPPPSASPTAPEPTPDESGSAEPTAEVPPDFSDSVRGLVDGASRSTSANVDLNKDLDHVRELLAGRTTVAIDPEPPGLPAIDSATTESAPFASGADLTLRIALRCQEILASSPFLQVALTRTSSAEKPTADQRVQTVNASQGRALVCLRVDRSRFKAAVGYRLYTPHHAVDPVAPDALARDTSGDSLAADAAYIPYENASLLLARFLDDEMARGGLVRAPRGLHLAPFYLLKRAAMPSATVSLGYVSNEADLARFGEAAYVEAAAASLAQGLLRFGRWLDGGAPAEAIE